MNYNHGYHEKERQVKKNVIFGGDYEKRGLFWRRDMAIIIAGMLLLALCTMDSIIRGPMIKIDKQIEKQNDFIDAVISQKMEIYIKRLDILSETKEQEVRLANPRQERNEER